MYFSYGEVRRVVADKGFESMPDSPRMKLVVFDNAYYTI